MLKIIRLACACLFILWLPALQAADSGWLQNPANDHAKVRLRADTSQPGRLACCCRSSCKRAGKPTGVPGRRRHRAGYRLAGQPAAGDRYWPTPQRFEVAGISRGYHDRVTLPIVMSGRIRPAGGHSDAIHLQQRLHSDRLPVQPGSDDAERSAV